MSDTIPIKLAEAALDAQEKQHQIGLVAVKALFDANAAKYGLSITWDDLMAGRVNDLALMSASLQDLRLTKAQTYVSKASFDETWVLYQQALEEGQQLKAELKQLRASSFTTAIPSDHYETLKAKALALAELTERKGLFYSKESQAKADAIIKQIRSL